MAQLLHGPKQGRTQQCSGVWSTPIWNVARYAVHPHTQPSNHSRASQRRPVPRAQSAYPRATGVARQAPVEDPDLVRSRNPGLPPDRVWVDEYDDPNDLGFWRMEVEDQAAFICNELDLSDEQALYLLHALGLLPEGASLEDLEAFRAGRDRRLQGFGQLEGTPADSVAELGLGADAETYHAEAEAEAAASREYEDGRPVRDALASWESVSSDDEDGFLGDVEERRSGGPEPSTSGSGHGVRGKHRDRRHGYRKRGNDHVHDANGGNGADAEALAPGPPHERTHESPPGSFHVSIKPNIAERKQHGRKVAPGVPAMAYDQSSFDRDFEVIQLRVIGRRASTAAAMGEEIELSPGKLIAGRYQVLEQVGSAAFSRAVQAYDTLERRLVCLKVVKNDKDCMDACLEEVRLLQMVNARDPTDTYHIARLYDYFYHMGHLFLVVELLGGNLFDTQCYDPTYFTAGRMQSIARQVLRALSFLHANHVIHADIKPENILVKNYSKCAVKLIDLGCSIYNSEAHMSHYVQSRSYRAPEVMLGLPYDGRIDVWSLGCVMAELATGQVLFPNVSEAAMMARLVGMLGELPPHMLQQGQYAGAFFTKSGAVYERNGESGLFELLVPKRTNLQARVPSPDRGMMHFIRHLLVPDPAKRPTAAQALKHPWLQYRYRSPK